MSGNNSFQPPPKSHTCTILSCCWLRKLRRVHRELCTSGMHTVTLLLCSKTTAWLCQAVGDTSGLFCISIDDELWLDTHIFEQEWNQPHWIVTAIIKHNDKVTFHWLFLAYTRWNIYYLDYKTQTSALWDCQGFSSKTLSNILIAFFCQRTCKTDAWDHWMLKKNSLMYYSQGSYTLFCFPSATTSAPLISQSRLLSHTIFFFSPSFFHYY